MVFDCSFGEHLSGGFLKMGHGKKRPLSLSHWSGVSFDADAADNDEDFTSSLNISMELKQGPILIKLQIPAYF